MIVNFRDISYNLYKIVRSSQIRAGSDARSAFIEFIRREC